MIKDMLIYLLTTKISIANVMVITTACACWFHNKWIAGLLTILVGGFIVAMVEVLLGV